MAQASGLLLAEGARFSESVSYLSQTTFVPKGVYRFISHEDANRHEQDCLVRAMGLRAAGTQETAEFSRPATLEDLKLLMRSLNEHGVEYLLIGGYALAAHGYQRATTDIDVLVPSTSEAGRRIRDALMALPDQTARDIEPEWFLEGERIRVADAFIVDIVLSANGQSYDALRQYSERIDLDGIPVETVNLEGLLLTKQTMREGDVADRIIIERALEVLREESGNDDARPARN